jgi:pimeloyl-ACP methyl ester carboxylesterase
MLPEILLTAPVGPAGGPLVVLGHSLGTGPLIWERVVPLLVSEFRVTLLSFPGHDGAPVPAATFTMAELADATAAAVRELADSGVLYAGVSIGGALGLELALNHPQLLAGAAIIASAASLGSREHWTQRAKTVRAESTAVLADSSAAAWFCAESIVGEPEFIGRILRALREVSDEGYARCAEALGGYDLREQLAQIRVPILAMGGVSDTVAPEGRQDEIVAGVQRGRKVMIRGAAHQPPAEQAEAVARALREFFDEVSE